MAMTTRFRVKKQVEPINQQAAKFKILEQPKVTVTSKVLGDEKRRVFGDIHSNSNRQGIIGDSTKAGVTEKKPLVYKDVKPRVDTRWKKTVTEQNSKPIVTSLAQAAPVPRPLSRQSSKGSDLVKKERTVKSITESITLQFKKTTSITSCIDLKKELKVKKENVQIESFIRSPQKIKLKEKTPTEKFFESHSTHLLHQVENIDKADCGNTQMLSEYVNDIYAYLMRLENIFPIRANFLEDQMDVTPKMRSVLLDWLNEVHLQFNLENETYHMAVSMIDRYLQAVPDTPRKYLQLVGVTALFMASKYEEMMPPEIADFVYVTDDTYQKDQILKMEMSIFAALDFNLAKPLPIHFLRRYSKAAACGDRQYKAAKYFIELASIDYEMTSVKPSEIAAASLYLSLRIMNKMKNDKDIWTPTLQYYSTYSVEKLMPIVKRLAVIVSTAQDVKLKSVFSKYSHASNSFTSTLPEMTGYKIQELVRSS